MEAIGCGCLLGIVLAVPIAILAAIAVGRQRNKLDLVDVGTLSDGDRARWRAYSEQLGRNVSLSSEQMRHVDRWLTY